MNQNLSNYVKATLDFFEANNNLPPLEKYLTDVLSQHASVTKTINFLIENARTTTAIPQYNKVIEDCFLKCAELLNFMEDEFGKNSNIDIVIAEAQNLRDEYLAFVKVIIATYTPDGGFSAGCGDLLDALEAEFDAAVRLCREIDGYENFMNEKMAIIENEMELASVAFFKKQ